MMLYVGTVCISVSACWIKIIHFRDKREWMGNGMECLCNLISYFYLGWVQLINRWYRNVMFLDIIKLLRLCVPLYKLLMFEPIGKDHDRS